MKLYLTAVQILTAVYLVGICAVQAQTAAQASYELGGHFATTTITGHDEGRRFPGTFVDTDGSLIFQGAPLISLIGEAYGTSEFQIVDGPQWIHTAKLYDIKAIPPPPQLVQSDRIQMLRALLAERFKLQLGETSREMTVLALEFAEATPALQLAESPRLRLPPDGKEGLLIMQRAGGASDPTNIMAELTLATVASFLSRELGQAVVDKTGLEGIWTMELEGLESPRRRLEFAPLLEQLGLRVAERTLTIDVLAITSIERPVLDD